MSLLGYKKYFQEEEKNRFFIYIIDRVRREKPCLIRRFLLIFLHQD